MITPARLLVALGSGLALLLAGCAPASTSPSPQPDATLSATASDFTRPGAAAAMVTQLLARTGGTDALMVEVTKQTVQVSVLSKDHQPSTWAYRNGEIAQVPSDLAYVDQAAFDVEDFNLSDVGALFRAAAGVAGSENDQSLTIVDYSGGEVMMSVSTVPESRTVFFNPDGSLLPVLDFDTPGGVRQGIFEALGSRVTVSRIGVESDQGAWVEYPNDTTSTVRRTRTAKVPVTTNVRDEKTDLPLYNASVVDPEVIWTVVARVRDTAGLTADSKWSVVADDRDGVGAPRLHFSIGSQSVVTDLAGHQVSR